MATIDYHLEELRIALDRDDPRWVLPRLHESDRVVVDVGCGIGQSLLALQAGEGRVLIGVDVDEQAVRYGMERHGRRIQFIRCDARRLPLPSGVADLVFSRVSLPYMDVPRALREMRRILRPGGRIWLTLHERRVALRAAREAWAARSPRRLLLALYTLANGWLLHTLRVSVPLLPGRHESWQDPAALGRMLERLGFSVQVRRDDRHTLVEGQLP
jgi:SAM-dependent methyltransferase